MNELQIISNNQLLDVYENEAISLNYQIEDILDITKKTTSYSKTIKLPGTPFNNKFFKHFFDVNIDLVTFNAKKQIPTIIRNGDLLVFSGVLQLLNVTINQREVEYEVVVVGTLKNILNELGEYSLLNLDLSQYNHKRSQTNIISSWTNNVIKNDVLTNVEMGDGYVYPYILYGQHNDTFNRLYASNLFPAVYVKTVMDKIFEFAGYTYTSSFFNSEYYRKLILPFTSDNIQMDDLEFSGRTTIVGVEGFAGNELTTPLLNQWSQYNTQSNTGYRAVSPVMFNYTSSQTYNNNSKGYWLPLQKVSGTTGDIEFQNPYNQWSFNNNQTGAFAKYTCNKAGYYDIKFVADMVVKYTQTFAGDVDYNSGDLRTSARLFHFRNGQISSILTQTDFPITFTPSSNTNQASPWYDVNGKIILDLAKSNFYLEEGDELRIGFTFSYFNINWAGNDQDVVSIALLPNVLNDKVTRFEIKPSSNILEGVDDDINMNQILPDLKLKDFFLSIVKMFNLVIVDDPNQSNNLLIEPRDEYFKSRTRVLDWTYKLDHQQNTKLIPMSELDANSFLFTYKEDDDYYNKQYQDEIKRIYGDYEINVENDFSNKQQKLELIFSPTPNSNFTIGDRVAPMFVNIEDNQFKPKKVKPRILFYGGLINTNNPYVLKDYKEQDNASGTTLTQYPYAGMWDHPYNPTYDLGFGVRQKIYYPVGEYPTNTVFEQFHKSTLLDIIDNNSKLMDAWFHLTPTDISDLDFRDIILIDNQYWRITKINNYVPTSQDRTTNVILYKLNNINIFAKDKVEIPVSNKSCPVDLVVVNGGKKKGRYYKSQSGEVITADCCKSLGGDFVGGLCYLPSLTTDFVGVGEVDGIVVLGGSSTGVSTNPLPGDQIVGNNTVGSTGVIVRGDRNNIDLGVGSGVVVGNNNSVLTGVENVVVIGSGITATESNTLYVGDTIKINENGVKKTNYIIDGGENEVMRVDKTNPIDILDGGFNSVRNYGGFSKERPIIDCNLGS
jgi:hypothetical protein